MKSAAPVPRARTKQRRPAAALALCTKYWQLGVCWQRASQAAAVSLVAVSLTGVSTPAPGMEM